MMFTLYSADYINAPGNCSYPHKIEVTDTASFADAVKKDYVCAEYMTDAAAYSEMKKLVNTIFPYFDTKALDAEIERQLEETQVIAEMVKTAVKENASTAQSQEAYLKKYKTLTERYEKAASELERLQTERTSRTQQDKKIALFIRTFKKLPDTMTGWDDTIWTVMVEKAIVHKGGRVTFVFKNGAEIKVGL